MSDGAFGAYKGYEYQISVSVWLALDLLIARELCTSITIEPASQEDVALDLAVDPDSATSTLILPTAVEIQIKLRSQTLTQANFRDLVFKTSTKKSRGPAPRPPPVARLRSDDQLRYTLITTAQVHRDLQDFVVAQVGAFSAAKSFQAEIDSANVLSRISVMPEWVSPLVTREIDALLLGTARIPFQDLQACRETLIELVRQCLLDRRSSVVTRDELLSQLSRFGGNSFARSPQFVPPQQYAAVLRRLSEAPFAVIVIGPPGVGKTFLAEYVADLHAQEIPAFRVHRNPSVDVVRDELRKPGRSVFYLEDPWGRYRPLESGQTWSDELPRLILANEGHPDKRFLITSRSSILLDSLGVLGSSQEHAQLGSFVIRLEAEDYDDRRRRDILHLWMKGSHRWQRDWLEKVEKEVLRELALPQALSIFSARLRAVPAGTAPELSALLKASNVAAISGAVADFVRRTDTAATAVVLWTFLGTSEPLDQIVSTAISVELQMLGEDVDLPRLVALLKENDWLREYKDRLSAHPSVVEGLEAIVASNPVLAHGTLARFFACLIANQRIPLAARLSRALKDRSIPVPGDVRMALNSYLKKAVLDVSDGDFVRLLELLCQVATGDDPFFVLARLLTPTRHGSPEVSPESAAPAIVAALRHQQDAEVLVRRWARLSLRHASYWSEEEALVELLCSFGWDLSKDFHQAAVDLLAYNSPNKIALLVALRQPNPDYERLLEAAFQAYDRADAWFEETGRLHQLEANECRVDSLYSGYLLDEPSEHFYAAESALVTIVQIRRTREGHRWITQHPRRDLLVDAWAKAIPDEAGECDAELRELLVLSHGWTRRHALEAVTRADAIALAPDIADILIRGPSGDLHYVWESLCSLLDADAFEKVAAHVLDAATGSRRLLVAYELLANRFPRAREIDADVKRMSVYRMLSRSERSAVALCIEWGKGNYKRYPLTEGTRRALLALTECDDESVASIACAAYSAHTRSPPPRLNALLASDEKEARLHCARAIRYSEPVRRDLLLRGLRDDYYQVRRFAMFSLAPGATPEERVALIACAQDLSGPVREACADIIADQQWNEALEVLVALLQDTRDIERAGLRSEFEENPRFHVARAAAAALLAFDAPLPAHIVQAIFAFVMRGADSSKDLVVHMELVRLLARHKHQELPELFVRLFASKRRAGGPDGTFPLRYAGYWGWLEHLGCFSEDAAQLPAEHFIDAATRTDDKIAGPALLILGFLAGNTPRILHMKLDQCGDDLRRRRLLYSAMRMAGHHKEAVDVLPQDDDARVVVDALWQPGMSSAQWDALLAANRGASDWLADVQKKTGLDACLRFAMSCAPNASLVSLSISDLRSDEVPRGIPMLSAFNFAGLE